MLLIQDAVAMLPVNARRAVCDTIEAILVIPSEPPGMKLSPQAGSGTTPPPGHSVESMHEIADVRE